jgi:hypothetical protein
LSIARDSKIKGSGKYGVLNQPAQPTQSAHFSHLDPLITNESGNSQMINTMWQILHGILYGFGGERLLFT